MAKVTQLSPEIIAELGDMKRYIDRLRRNQVPDENIASRFREKQVRIARTTTGLDCSTYPTGKANTYVVELGKGDFDFACGLNEHTFTPYQPRALRYAHSIEDAQLDFGTTVLVMLIHDKWYIVKSADPGRIIGKLQNDKTREKVGGLSIGRGNVLIDDILGDVPDSIGDTVEVIFGNLRWDGAVKGCTVIADYIDGVYSATESQELAAGFWAYTLEDRTTGGPQQDVTVQLVQRTGHANADFIPDPSTGTAVECGYILQTWDGVKIVNDYSQFNFCCIPDWNTYPFPENPTLGQQHKVFGIPTVKCVPPTPSTLKVRFLADTFQDMRQGALVWVTHDNDLPNEEDNSGMYWYAIQCNQLDHTIRATLTQDMCGVDPAFESVTGNSPFPFSQLPVGTPEIKNLDNRAGKAGDTITCTRNSIGNFWFIVAVTKHKITTLTNYRDELNAQTGCYEKKVDKQDIYTEICDDPVEQIILTYKQAFADKITDFHIDTTQSVPTLTIDFTRQEFYAVCDPGVPLTETIPLVDSKNIDECLRVGCDEQEERKLEAHFIRNWVLYKDMPAWQGCIDVIACDGSECYPGMPEEQLPPPPQESENEELPPPPHAELL